MKAIKEENEQNKSLVATLNVTLGEQEQTIKELQQDKEPTPDMSNDQQQPGEQNEAIEELKSKIEQLESSNAALNRQVSEQ